VQVIANLVPNRDFVCVFGQLQNRMTSAQRSFNTEKNTESQQVMGPLFFLYALCSSPEPLSRALKLHEAPSLLFLDGRSVDLDYFMI
jgi:hypothetical protein